MSRVGSELSLQVASLGGVAAKGLAGVRLPRIVTNEYDSRMAYTAYVDCSGDAVDPQTKVIAVAGYIAHDDQWTEFSRRWSSVLNSYGITSLHMKDFAHSVREFSSWKGVTTKRNGFIAALTDIINTCTMESVSTAMLVDAYTQCDNRYALRETLGPPYAVAMLTTLARTAQWHRRRQLLEPLSFVIERGDNEQTAFRRVLERLGKWDLGNARPPAIQAKRWVDALGVVNHCLPLQAADFLSYETAKMFTDYLGKGKRVVRESIFRVSYPPRGDDKDQELRQFMAPDTLAKLAEGLSIVRRYNLPIDKGEPLPLDPLCYLSTDCPLVCWASRDPLPRQKSDSRWGSVVLNRS